MERTYVIVSEEWTASANPLPPPVVERIEFELFANGIHVGTATITWYEHARTRRPSPRLEVWEDGWAMLALLAEEGFLESLRRLDSSGVTPSEFCGVLTGLGFTDATARERPPGSEAPSAPCPVCGHETRA